MYRVFLVEDEVLVREAIRDIIDWKSAGFDFVGEASDGEQALPLIAATKPDILITDIKMPFMNGLELSREVKRLMPWVKIIIVSGHDEFDYTREAISISVDEYLLKPISSCDLLEALNQMADSIDRTKEEKEADQILRSGSKENLDMIRGKFLLDLVSGVMPYDEAIHGGRSLGLDLVANYYAVILTELSGQGSEGKCAQYQDFLEAESLLDRLAGPSHQFLKCKMNLREILFIAMNQDLEALESACHDFVHKIKDEVEKKTACQLSASIGSIKDRLEDLAGSLEDAKTLMEFGYVFTKSKMAEIQEAKAASAKNKAMITLDESRLIEYLRYEDEDTIMSKLVTCLHNIKEQELNSIFYTQLFTNIMIAVVRFLGELGEKVEYILPEFGNIDHMVNSIFTIDSFIHFLTILISRTIECRDNKKKSKYGDVIWKAKYYIDNNYTDSKLSLSRVADHVNMSSSHLSTIFSQEIEMTFIEYLTHVRITKAKEQLATTNLKSSEIAYRIGYNDHHYFSHVFKKVTGMRPTDYRSAKA